MQAEPDVPIACSLPSGALEQRLAWIRHVTASNLLSHQLDGATLKLQYRIDALPNLQQIIERERQCCSFLDYSLQHSAQAVQLTITAPNGLGPDARWLFDQFLPQSIAAPKKACGCKPGACG